MRYNPRTDEHPVATALRAIGPLTLVGSRCFNPWHKLAGPESDWDYYLTFPGEGEERDNEENRTRAALECLGFERLPGFGGPYGEDGAIAGIWRLPAVEMFGRAWSNVDVIVLHESVATWRLPVLARMSQSKKIGELCRGIKSERAWGTFWWVINPAHNR